MAGHAGPADEPARTRAQARADGCAGGLAKGRLLARTDAKPDAEKAGKKPNILVIFGDDIGQANVSAYSHGVMGYRTPNIDRIAREGMLFTDYYAERNCTAGRSSPIGTGTSPTPRRSSWGRRWWPNSWRRSKSAYQASGRRASASVK